MASSRGGRPREHRGSGVQTRWRLYANDQGRAIVKEELEALGRDASAEIAKAMKRMRTGDIRASDVKPVSGDLYELRVALGNNPYRLLFARVGQHEQVLLGLHALYKNTQKLPKTAIQTANRRLSDWTARSR